MTVREPDWCPIIFSGDDPSGSRLLFTLYLRRPEVGPDIIDGQVQIKMGSNGYTNFQAFSGRYATSPSSRVVEAALRKKLRGLEDREGKVLQVVSENLIRMKDKAPRDKEQWQLDAVADLRGWLYTFEVEAGPK